MADNLVTVFGASGRTGLEILKLLPERNIQVNAFCRNESSIPFSNTNMHIFEGDIFKLNDVKAAVINADCIVIALGTKAPYKDVFCYDGTINIIKAMYEFNIKRLICVTGASIGDYPGNLSRFMTGLKKRFNKKYPMIAMDRLKQEMAVKASGLNWTILKPPRLSNGTLSSYVMGDNLKISAFSAISRRTLSLIIFEIIKNSDTFKKALFVKK